jgi:tryptophan synthase alpha chain
MTAPHESIAAAIRRTSAAGRPAIIAYLTGGFPDRASFARNLEAIASEADVVEIGVPFSDPMAMDSRSSARARPRCAVGSRCRGCSMNCRVSRAGRQHRCCS